MRLRRVFHYLPPLSIHLIHTISGDRVFMKLSYFRPLFYGTLIFMKNTVSADYNPSGYTNEMTHGVFNPNDYIEVLEDGFALCSNPMADGGLSAITVNTKLAGESLRNFEASVKRMVLAKLFSPKFGEVILTATRINHAH